MNGGPATLNGGPGGRCQVPTDTNCYTNPYKGSDQLLEVRLQMPVTTFFTASAHIIGPFSVVGARGGERRRDHEYLHDDDSRHDDRRHDDQRHDDRHDGSGHDDFSTSTSSSTTTTSAGNIALFAKDSVVRLDRRDHAREHRQQPSRHRSSRSRTAASTINGNPQTHLDTAVYGGPNNCTIGGSRGAAASARRPSTPTSGTGRRRGIPRRSARSPGATVYNDTLTHTVPNNANGIFCALNGGLALGGDGNDHDDREDDHVPRADGPHHAPSSTTCSSTRPRAT